MVQRNGCRIFHRRVWYRALLCAIRVFDVRASFSPIGYLCAKFRLFRGLRCWASQWRKIAYSIIHSASQSPSLFDAPGIRNIFLSRVYSAYASDARCAATPLQCWAYRLRVQRLFMIHRHRNALTASYKEWARKFTAAAFWRYLTQTRRSSQTRI